MKTICLSLLLLFANVPRQTTGPGAQWSLAGDYIRNTLGALDYELERLAEEFPRQLAEYKRRAEVKDLSLFFYTAAGRGVAEGWGCLVSAQFRYPLAPDEKLPRAARVYSLKNGRRIAMWSLVRATGDAAGKKFERVVGGLIRAKQAQLLDLLGADTRGSTRDLDAVPFDGTLTQGQLYRAELVFVREGWQWRTTVPLRAPAHHSAAVEWENLTDFPSFYSDRPKDERPEVVFEVVGKEVEYAGRRGWKTTYRCRVLGVEGEPPRAEYLTLVAGCRRTSPNGKRNLGYDFTFDVRRVVAGSFDAREFGIELTAESGGGPLLRALRGEKFDWKEQDCAGSKDVEMTFELPRGERATTHPGVLQEFRLVE